LFESIFKSVFEKLTEPIQLISMAVIVCLFLVIRMMIQLLNRKEDILEGLVQELISHGNSVKEAVTLLEFLVLGKHKKG